MTHRVAPRAETDLDDIWLYVAKESGSIEIANRLIDTITNRFFMLAGFPYVGRARDDDFGPGCRSLSRISGFPGTRDTAIDECRLPIENTEGARGARKSRLGL
jgi:plasmid stabilization system protein ParE